MLGFVGAEWKCRRRVLYLNQKRREERDITRHKKRNHRGSKTDRTSGKEGGILYRCRDFQDRKFSKDETKLTKTNALPGNQNSTPKNHLSRLDPCHGPFSPEIFNWVEVQAVCHWHYIILEGRFLCFLVCGKDALPSWKMFLITKHSFKWWKTRVQNVDAHWLEIIINYYY